MSLNYKRGTQRAASRVALGPDATARGVRQAVSTAHSTAMLEKLRMYGYVRVVPQGPV